MPRFFQVSKSALRMLRVHARILPGGCCAVLDESSPIGTFLLNFPANHIPGLEEQPWGATLSGKRRLQRRSFNTASPARRNA
jgi:hypothetical protein